MDVFGIRPRRQDYMIGAGVFSNAGQSIPSATNTFISFQVIDFDSHGHFNPVVNNTQINIIFPGAYYCWGSIEWQNASLLATDTYRLYIQRNGLATGSTFFFTSPPAHTGVPAISTGGIIKLKTGDFIQLGCYQSDVASANTTTPCTFGMGYLGD